MLLPWLAAAALAVLPAFGGEPSTEGWQAGAGCRWRPLRVGEQGRTGLRLLSSLEAGIGFTNLLSKDRYLTNQVYLNGSGVAAGDVDGDGWCDLYFCGLDRPNALYRNLGNWTFEDITAASGVALAGRFSTGAVFADIDGDGDLDLIVNTVGNGTWVFVNDGRGHFAELEPGAPLNLLKGGTTLTLADVDGDGDLDLYVANYRTTTVRDMPNVRLRVSDSGDRLTVVAMNDRPTTDADLVGRFTLTRDGKFVENGEADVLYLNDGRGHFTVVPWTGGGFLDEDGQPLKEPPYDWGLTAAFRDLNGDRAPDLYVCNDFESPDRIWINDGKGRFRLIGRLAIRQTSIFSMGVDFADLDRDGSDEIFVSDMLSRDHAKRMLETGEIKPVHLPLGAIDNRPQYSHNMLFHSRGDGTYEEISQFAGVQASEWTWSPQFIDVDLDGYEDLLITTGHELQMMNGDIINRAEEMKAQRQMSSSELQRMRALFPRYAIPKVAFRNRGNLTFEEVSAAWGFDVPGVGNGMALADLDNDGDLDVAVNNLNGRAEVYRNEGVAPRLAVRLKGLPPNTSGIGARIEVRGGPVPRQSQELGCGGHYLSGGQALRVFAAGSLTNRLTIEVRWRSGRRSLVSEAAPNRLYEIDEAGASPEPPPAPREPSPAPLFADASERLRHTHHEEAFDDFARQPLLPHRLSQLGPGVSWLDVDGNGWDDLLIGSGKGGALACYLNAGQGAFARSTNNALNRILSRDQTTVLGFGALLLAGSSNYEDGATNGGAVRIYDLARQATGESVLGCLSSTGPLAMADYDGDGDLDVFVGGRVVPGKYPAPATSLLLRNEGGRLTVVQRFERLGLVSGAMFADLNGDGTPELVLACEWGPVRILRLEGGQYRDFTREAGLEALTGWWAGVAAIDVDGDGDLDLVASNWGLNSSHLPTPQSPIWIRYGDFAENGSVDTLESYLDPATGKEVPRRGLHAVRAALPFVQEVATNFEAYGKCTLADLYGDRLKSCATVEATTLATMLFLNEGGRFRPVPLPAPAQWAPAFGVCVADFDGDGHEDVFLSQNFFGVTPESWRHDSGRGLLLLGDGRGGFAAMPGEKSGIAIYGEQRGCAAADYDGDGRVDLAVGQNAAPTVLLRNQGARPGLRVRLAGPPGNPAAVGACLRLKFGERLGPAREIQAGSGYWSNNSAVQVLATPEAPTQVWVRWPGGRTTTSGLPPGAREVLVDPTGTAKLLK